MESRSLFEFVELAEERLTEIESVLALLGAAPGDITMGAAAGSFMLLSRLTTDVRQAVDHLHEHHLDSS